LTSEHIIYLHLQMQKGRYSLKNVWQERVFSVGIPYADREPAGGDTTVAVLPVQHQTYQIVLLGERESHVCEPLPQGRGPEMRCRKSNMRPVDGNSSAITTIRQQATLRIMHQTTEPKKNIKQITRLAFGDAVRPMHPKSKQKRTVKLYMRSSDCEQNYV